MNWDLNYNIRIYMGGVTPSLGNASSQVPQPTGLYEIGVQTHRPDSLYVYMGNGRHERFTTDCVPNTDGNMIDPEPCVYTNDMYDKVVEFSHEAYPVVLRDSSNTTYTFFPSRNTTSTISEVYEYGGRLASITDRNGNQISFSYETSVGGHERIEYAIDTLGHRIDFRYWDDSALGSAADDYYGGILWQIEDHAGRVVEYEYANLNDNSSSQNDAKLIKATLPVIESNSDFPLLYTDDQVAVDHGRFPNGRTWEYTYTGFGSGLYKDGLMSTIKDPNGVVIIENIYEDNFQARMKGRVKRQVYGGDAYNYTVTKTDGGMAFNIGTESRWYQDYYVWVNDRRGAITRFKYSGNDNTLTDVPGQPDQPRHQQLLEKVEYSGLVDDPDSQVWATYDTAGNLDQWNTFDSSGQVIALPGTQPAEANTVGWVPNKHWSTEVFALPLGDSSGIVYDDDSDNPLHWKTILTRTQTSASPAGTIIEEWDYNFEFAGGGGCGCGGSGGFETGYKDGRGIDTIKDYDGSGNVIAVYHDLIGTSDIETTPAQAAGVASAINEFTYNQWGQILTHTHPSKTTLDTNGNEVIHRRVDQYEYYPDNPTTDPENSGRLHKMHVDVNGEDLITEYEYDLVGNVIKATDPGGDITEYLYNQASQLVREQHFDTTGSISFSETTYLYDANGNRTVQEVKNLDGNQVLDPNNKVYTSVYLYDVLNFRTSASMEHGVFTSTVAEELDGSRRAKAPSDTDTDFVTQKWEYDPNRNLTKHLLGEAVNGNQSTNVTKYEYDYRDLLVKNTVGVGDSTPYIVSTIYDEKGRRTNVTVDPAGDTQSQSYEIFYDGFDRVLSYSDPMGNEVFYEYDSNHNMLSSYFCGPLDVDTDSGTDSGDTLYRVTNEYDERDRMVKQLVDVYDYDYLTGSGLTCGSVPSGASQQITEYVYNRDSSIRTLKELSGAVGVLKLMDYYYDTASRIQGVVDGTGNDLFNEYDADSNLLKLTRTDFSTINGASFEKYVKQFEYDALNRQSATIDGVGNRTEFKYDSRHNTVEVKDARGNLTNLVFDGIKRQKTSSVIMTDTGDGTGVYLSPIETHTVYDDSNRVLSVLDDNGNTTSYEYDGLDRITRIIIPDGEYYNAVYDFNGNITTYTDARGVVSTNLYDLNNRLISRSLSGTSVAGATSEAFTYDGMGRIRTAINSMGTDGLTSIVREYDSRSNVVREIQNSDGPGFSASGDRTVQYKHDDANNMNKIIYPGGREVYRTFDKINRMTGIFNDVLHIDPITKLDYIGHRLTRREHGNGTQTDYAYNGFIGSQNHVDDLGFSRVSGITTTKPGTGILDAFAFRWDAVQNRTSYIDTGSGMKNRRERTFGYGSSDRLVSTDVDFPNPNTDYINPTNSGITDYDLDGVHNRFSVTGFEEAGAPIGTYKDTSVDDTN